MITSNFTKAAYARATSLGMPGVRIVVLPSPLTPKSIPQVKQMAHDYAEEIVGLLTSTFTQWQFAQAKFPRRLLSTRTHLHPEDLKFLVPLMIFKIIMRS